MSPKPSFHIPTTPQIDVTVEPFSPAEIERQRYLFTKFAEYATEFNSEVRAVVAIFDICLAAIRSASDREFVAFLGSLIGQPDPDEMLRRSQLFISHVLARDPIGDAQ